jgi:hypothetical protein
MSYRVSALGFILFSVTGLSLLDTVGCTDDGKPTQPAFEAGAFDSSIPDGSTPDSGTPDSTTPDSDIDEPAIGVRVNVTRGGATPLAGITVVFQDANGAVIGTATSDNNGTVFQSVPSGSQVTALLGPADSPNLLTVMSVEPGDTIQMDQPDLKDVRDVSAVNVTALPSAPGGTISYVARAGQNVAFPNATPFNIGVDPPSQNNGRFPILVEALDDSAQPTHFVFQKSNALVPDSGVPDGGILDLAIGGSWSTPLTTVTINTTNAPQTTDFVASYGEIADGVLTAQQAYFQVENGTHTENFRGHPGFPSSVQPEVHARVIGQTGGISYNAIATRGAPLADGGTYDMDMTQLLPSVSASEIDSTDAGTSARPSVTWTASGSMAAADGVIVRISWVGDSDAGIVYGTWTFVAPPTTTSIRAPALPASSGTYEPSGSPSFSSIPIVAFIEGSFLPGYAQLRQAPASIPPTDSLIRDQNGAIVPPLPVDGTLRLSAITIDGD